ncbi:unnamed protein product [Onchocerca flexuosa]|uniref:Uncharacterized protein n=1 Tax=Onchocerca flexuosa TaxID=387005 RepID=A0A183HVX9_9BILA|nr:unnamed protein product [Onchocerca flexuosa]
MIKSVKTRKVLCPGKLENGESCTAGFHISVEIESVNQNQKGSRKHCVANDFEEQDEYNVDFCNGERMHDAEM